MSGMGTDHVILGPMRGLGTDHVILGPMRGLKIDITGRGQTDGQTSQLAEIIGLRSGLFKTVNINKNQYYLSTCV